jgi:ubiquinone/menaquinone biosynthesis C-methylase UbiE
MRDDVREYYGEVLEHSDDLKTDACCTIADVPAHLSKMLSRIHPEVTDRYYGCGLLAPEALEGCDILDLGSGSGRDCYLLAQLVGESGSVTGIDMTEQQLAVANRHLDFHREQFGYATSNVRFIQGDLEAISSLGLSADQFDVIVSNCVVNLIDDKASLLREAMRLLKPGGEFHFSDVYANRRIPRSLRDDATLRGECLSGALYVNDFLQMAREAGFADPRLLEHRPLAITNPQIEQQLDGYEFSSVTYRLFKAKNLEPGQEDYGQTAVYDGSVAYCPESLTLDWQTTLPCAEPIHVSGNTARLISQSRWAEHVRIEGSFCCHQGEFKLPSASIFGDNPVDATGVDIHKPLPSGCC